MLGEEIKKITHVVVLWILCITLRPMLLEQGF